MHYILHVQVIHVCEKEACVLSLNLRVCMCTSKPPLTNLQPELGSPTLGLQSVKSWDLSFAQKSEPLWRITHTHATVSPAEGGVGNADSCNTRSTVNTIWRCWHRLHPVHVQLKQCLWERSVHESKSVYVHKHLWQICVESKSVYVRKQAPRTNMHPPELSSPTLGFQSVQSGDLSKWGVAPTLFINSQSVWFNMLLSCDMERLDGKGLKPDLSHHYLTCLLHLKTMQLLHLRTMHF